LRETIFDVMFLIESLTPLLLAFFAILINKNNPAVFYYLSLSLEVSSLSSASYFSHFIAKATYFSLARVFSGVLNIKTGVLLEFFGEID